jgi:membrane protein
VVAAVAWLAGWALLSWYLANFANYDATYGSRCGDRHDDVDVFSAIVILFGAELNSEIEHQTVKESTVEGD